MNNFETEDFKDLKQKEKMLLYVLAIFLIAVYYILSLLGDSLEKQQLKAYNIENEKIYKTALFKKNAVTNKLKPEDIDVDLLIKDSNTYIKSLKDKTLNYNDLNNYKYIEYFINYHLNKIGQANIRLGNKDTKYVNFREQGIKIKVVSDKPEDITYLLQTFNDAGYLGGFEVNKTGNLYEVSIKLIFIIN